MFSASTTHEPFNTQVSKFVLWTVLPKIAHGIETVVDKANGMRAHKIVLNSMLRENYDEYALVDDTRIIKRSHSASPNVGRSQI